MRAISRVYRLVLLCCCAAAACGWRAAVAEPPRIAEKPMVVWRSPDPKRVYPRSPGLCRLDDSRLIITMEYNQGGSRHMPGTAKTDDGKDYRGRVFVSDDGGRTVRETGCFPLYQGRPFVAGGVLYYLGHYGDLGIIRSTDRGETWSAVSWLTKGQDWHQAPCNLRYAHGRVYLVMERHMVPLRKYWPVFSIAPVVLSASVDADLMKRESWTFSNEVSFSEMLANVGSAAVVGAPFYAIGGTVPGKTGRESRPMAPLGWLETHIVTFPDPNHLWHDPGDWTMHLYMRAHTGRTNLACVAKAVEDPATHAITVQPATAPTGTPMLYMPFPGGHLKFHILYDAPSKRYWLVSNQPTDSMTRPDKLPESRYSLPENERHRLVLHFSRNAMDWVFAGVVDMTDDPRRARSYPAMIVDGADLLILARSGGPGAKNAHDGDLLTLHRVPDFRGLVY